MLPAEGRDRAEEQQADLKDLRVVSSISRC
jgi:hypothetical protein